jgi:hypothetical protein
MNRISKKMLLGLGLDSKDGHIRITTGKNFRLFGGSEKTHEAMQAQAIEFNRKLDSMQKTLDDINEKEFFKLAKAVGLNIPKKQQRGGSKDGKNNGR